MRSCLDSDIDTTFSSLTGKFVFVFLHDAAFEVQYLLLEPRRWVEITMFVLEPF